MTISLEQLQQRFNDLNPREKLMTVGAVIVLLWALWDNLLNQSLQSTQTGLKTEISTLENNLLNQRQLIQQLADSNDPQKSKQQKLSALQASISNMQNQLGAGEKKFVPPQLMSNALRDMLKQQGNLNLISLETLPASPFGDLAQQEQQTIWVYKHAMKLTVQGDFFSTLAYLKLLENLPWRIHWDSIDYQVQAYPQAETHIQVYTLSFEKDLLGA